LEFEGEDVTDCLGTGRTTLVCCVCHKCITLTVAIDIPEKMKPFIAKNKEQPDPVCVCGKTSTCTCRSCGQDMDKG